VHCWSHVSWPKSELSSFHEMNRQDIDFMDVVFPTFPSDTDIRGIVDDLKSGKYWIIIYKA